MTRKSTGKRLRFEIMKRDGFKCRYCGHTAMMAVLQVDHVVPVSDGGDDRPENLATACIDCNGGKSDVRLDESELGEPTQVDVIREHTEQVRAMLTAAKALQEAKRDYVSFIFETCAAIMGEAPRSCEDALASISAKHTAADIANAAQIAISRVRSWSSVSTYRYFFAVLRNQREDRHGA